MLQRIWLTPPLGIARVGSAPKPCQAYSWARGPVAPGTRGKTTLRPEDTLELDEDGVVTVVPSHAQTRIAFKDEQGRFHPVCPFFELHGEWTEGGEVRTGPVTQDVLTRFGPSIDGRPPSPSDVVWEVVVANLKAHHYTLADSDRVEARVRLTGGQTRRVTLEGRTPREVRGRPVTGEPLIPPDRFMPMGAVQVARADPDVPGGLRLRVYAPAGHVYGPTDLSRRAMPRGWEGFTLRDREIVNPASKWATLRIWENVLPPLPSPDARNNPAGLAAVDREGMSLGLIDDVGDGLVSCTIPGLPTAHARIAVGPPDFAPDARPVVSLQDGLADRIDRAAARADAIPMEELEALVHDIFERALEASDLMNKDAQSDRAHRENGEQLLPPPPSGYQDRAVGTLWPRPDAAPAGNPPRPNDVDPLPVSARGQRKHRRLNAVEYLKDRLRDEPGYIDDWLRPPVDASPAYDRRMPALMRNSDRYPLHLTRRQYEIVRRWAAQLAAGRDAGGNGPA